MTEELLLRLLRKKLKATGKMTVQEKDLQNGLTENLRREASEDRTAKDKDYKRDSKFGKKDKKKYSR